MIVNVARCSWLHLVPFLLRVNVPIWLYSGIPPAFGQPLNDKVLYFTPRSHPQLRALALSAQPVGPRVPSAHVGPGQLPGETWKEFMVRQNLRKRVRIQKKPIVSVRCEKAMKKQPQNSHVQGRKVSQFISGKRMGRSGLRLS